MSVFLRSTPAQFLRMLSFRLLLGEAQTLCSDAYIRDADSIGKFSPCSLITEFFS